MRDKTVAVLVGGALLALLCLWASLRLRRRHRLLRDTPTSKAAGVFIGAVEVKGTAECADPITSALARQACVQYRYTVEEHWSRTVTETTTGSDGKSQTLTRHESGWTTVADGGDAIAFYIRDDTGAVRVRPEGARIEPASFFEEIVTPTDALYYAKGPPSAVANSDQRRRFVETGIPLHAPLFVVGAARERDDVVAAEIAANKDAPLFLISTRTEERVQAGTSFGSWTLWALGLVCAIAGPVITGWRAVPRFPREQLISAGCVALAAYLLIWGVSWIWMAFNSLVGLRNRVRQAWSLIDVQLKRRQDLIPTLAAAVGGLQVHEREVQTALAALRGQLTATPPGVTGPDFMGVAAELRAVVEKYPHLCAQEGFAALHDELVETEQRIALARTYYNDIATHFATRLEQVPDRWVALLGGMRPQPLLAAEGFEREVVAVQFAA